MNPKATSREAILETCRGIVRKQGLSGINVRAVASACGVAPGTLYNYFPDKNALVLAVTADVWSDVFCLDGQQEPGQGQGQGTGFATHVKRIFKRAREGMARYPGILPTHVLDLAGNSEQRSVGQDMMRSFFARVQDDTMRALESDSRVKPDAFSGNLSKRGFVELVTQQIIVLLILGKDNCDALVATIKTALY